MKKLSSLLLALPLALLGGPSAKAASLTYANEVQIGSPYAYYRVGEVSGTVAADASGNSRPGAYVNSPTLGIAGYPGPNSDTAAGFNRASSQYVSLNNLSTFGSQLGAFTLEFVFSTSDTANLGSLFGVFNTNSNTALQVELNSNGGSLGSGVTRFFLRAEGGHSYSANFTNASLYSGQYVHLALTFDKTLATQLGVYVNGSAVSFTPSGSNNLSSTDTFANFGFNALLSARANRATIDEFASTTIDEAAFYTSALSASTIASHYAALTAVPEPSSAVLLSLGSIGILSLLRKGSGKLRGI
jgi:hypothetical protein